MLRPILILSDGDDPTVMYGVRQIDLGAHYVTALLEKGIWQKKKLRTDVAKAYVDQEVERRGELFEQEIAQIFRDAGWVALSPLIMRSLGAPDELGDLDILAMGDGGRMWMVIECKWFGAVRTPREIASWAQDFRGETGDKLYRHLRRFAWIRQNSERIARALAVVTPDSVVPKIVTMLPVPLAFQRELPDDAGVWTKRELTTALGAGKRAS